VRIHAFASVVKPKGQPEIRGAVVRVFAERVQLMLLRPDFTQYGVKGSPMSPDRGTQASRLTDRSWGGAQSNRRYLPFASENKRSPDQWSRA